MKKVILLVVVMLGLLSFVSCDLTDQKELKEKYGYSIENQTKGGESGHDENGDEDTDQQEGDGK